MKKLFAITICLFSIISVVWSAPKTTFSQITYKNTESNRVYIYKSGVAFQGYIYSEDGRSVQLQTNEYGMVNKITFYHQNGKPCWETTISREGTFRNSVHYDINGFCIDGETWEDEYEEYFQQLWYMIPENLTRCLFL